MRACQIDHQNTDFRPVSQRGDDEEVPEGCAATKSSKSTIAVSESRVDSLDVQMHKS